MDRSLQEKPGVILADWDEEIGPVIVKSIFPALDAGTANNPEVIATRCYVSAESIFAKEKFSKIHFNLPLIAIKKLAVVSFDIISDDTVRGAHRPFMLILFVPLDTSYSITDALLQVTEPFIETYKGGQVPDLEALQDKALAVLESGAGTSPARDSSKEELKKELSELVKEHMTRLGSQGISLNVYKCPGCGTLVYPDEIACTKCRLIIRTYCDRCNALVERNLKQCSRCGNPNRRYDGMIKLEVQKDVDELDLLAETGLADTARDTNVSHVARSLGLDPEQDFDASSSDLEKEIEALKLKLDDQQKKTTKARLFETFTRNYGGYKVGDEDIPSQSLGGMLKEAAVDEVDLLIKSMAVLPPDEKTGKAEPDKVVKSWDCEAYLQAAGRVLVGLGSNPLYASGIPGIMIVTDTAVMFVSYLEQLGGISRLFAYFDASLQHLGDCNKFHPDLSRNSMIFRNHGIIKQKLPLEPTFSVNFTWSADKAEGGWEHQAQQLKSTLQRLQLFSTKPPIPAGRFFFFTGKPPSDNSIKSVLAGITVFAPQAIKIIKARFSMLA
ncbi:MAG: zinc ribbon domain-containing protein [Candidatus Lokiarchaeota archaeon]|nr:zinc ribbon domain-containing protein [Candidatus Lokiarchaeota archaeon]